VIADQVEGEVSAESSVFTDAEEEQQQRRQQQQQHTTSADLHDLPQLQSPVQGTGVSPAMIGADPNVPSQLELQRLLRACLISSQEFRVRTALHPRGGIRCQLERLETMGHRRLDFYF
jgi:hypothetical protein